MEFRQFDLLSDDASILGQADSVSCLHALEHFGLGRYGDPVEPMGWKIGLNALIQIVEVGGSLFLSVPIGPQRVEFDAHRVFSVKFLLEHLEVSCEVADFAYVDDQGELLAVGTQSLHERSDNFGCQYGLGIFHLIKRSS